MFGPLSLSAFAALASTKVQFSQQPTSSETQVLLVNPESSRQKQHPLLNDPHVQQAIKAEQFGGQYGKKLEILAPTSGVSRLLLLGTGALPQLTAAKSNHLGGELLAYLRTKPGIKNASVDARVLETSAAALAQGIE